MDDSQPIIVDPSLLQIDMPSMETSTLLLDMMDSLNSAHMAMHFAYWALPVPGYDALIIDPATSEDIVYGGGVGGSFATDTSVCCDDTSQRLVHSDIHGPMTTCSYGGAMCLLTLFDKASTPRSAGSFSLLRTDSSIDESWFASVDPSILLPEATFA